MPPEYNTAVIRELITGCYSDEALDAMCFDHFSEVHKQFTAGMSLPSKVQKLLEHVRQNERFEELLDIIQEKHPDKYERVKGRLIKRSGRGSTIVVREQPKGAPTAGEGAGTVYSAEKEPSQVPSSFTPLDLGLVRPRVDRLSRCTEIFSDIEQTSNTLQALDKAIETTITLCDRPGWDVRNAQNDVQLGLGTTFPDVRFQVAQYLRTLGRAKDNVEERDREEMLKTIQAVENTKRAIDRIDKSLAARCKESARIASGPAGAAKLEKCRKRIIAALKDLDARLDQVVTQTMHVRAYVYAAIRQCVTELNGLIPQQRKEV